MELNTLHNLRQANVNIVEVSAKGSFHSKLILYEFDDRLRIIVTSANLSSSDWLSIHQAIWFQDFFKQEKLSALSTLSEESKTTDKAIDKPDFYC